MVSVAQLSKAPVKPIDSIDSIFLGGLAAGAASAASVQVNIATTFQPQYRRKFRSLSAHRIKLHGLQKHPDESEFAFEPI